MGLVERQAGYRNAGRVEQFGELKAIWEAIWSRASMVQLPDGTKATIKSYKGGTLWAVEHKGLKYIQQNPNTRSAYADRAKGGSKIVWVIRQEPNEYLGYIENGVVWMK
jgi:hypothetical protein